MKKFTKLFAISSFFLFSYNTYSEAKISNINLKVSLKQSTLQDIVEKEVPKDFSGNGSLIGEQAASSSGNKLLGLGLSILQQVKPNLNYNILWNYVLQRGPIQLNVNNSTVTATTNFTGTATGGLEKDAKEKTVSTDFSGNLGVISNITLTENWDLKAKTTPQLTLNNTTLPLKFDIAGFPVNENVNIGNEIQKQINPILNKAGGEIDSKISEFNLKEYVNKEWTLLKDPISVEKNYDAWLVVRPKKASYGSINSENERLNVVVGSDADLALYIGKPQNIAPLGTLPKINQTQRDNSSIINLPIIANYANIQRELDNNIGEKTLSLGYGAKATINNTSISGGKDLINLKTDFIINLWGMFDLKGILSAEGKPGLTEDKKILKISDFAFNIQSDNFLIKIADKLFHNMILKKIQENYLTLDLSKDLPKLQSIVAEKAKSVVIDKEKDIILKNDIKSVDVLDILITEQEITIFTQIRGSSVLEINSL